MAAQRQIRYRRGRDALEVHERYIFETAVEQPDELPPRKKIVDRTSRQVLKNRRKALDLRPSYVVFFAAVSVCALVICTAYLKLLWEAEARTNHIAALQEKLVDLTERNDMAYSEIEDSVDLEEVREKAINDLGMVYAFEGQVVEYTFSKGSVIQYGDIPQGRIFAKSGQGTGKAQ